MLDSPDLPPGVPYTSCYCEENVYLLAHRFCADATLSITWDPLVIFVSNHHKTVALWKQKAGARDESGLLDGLVVWDYHVFFVLRPNANEGSTPDKATRRQSWVYDVDSILPTPCEASVYFPATFRPCAPIYESLFRVIPAAQYLDNFASDRSHMLVDHTIPVREEPGIAASGFDGEVAPPESAGAPARLVYRSPAPGYPPICGPAALARSVQHNLMHEFVDMSAESFGRVVTLAGIVDLLDLAEGFGWSAEGLDD